MIYVTMGVGLGGATDDMSGVMDIVDDIAMQTPYLGVGAISPPAAVWKKWGGGWWFPVKRDGTIMMSVWVMKDE